MQFSFAVVASLLAGSAFAATGADAIKADVNAISYYLKQLSGDTDQYTSLARTVPFALQIQIDSVNIDKVLRQGTADANASPMLSDGDSLAIGFQLIGVSNDVNATLAKISSKVTQFADLQPIVLKTLYGLKQSTDTFGAALIKKLGFIEQLAASGVTKNLDTSFNNAIVVYGGKASELNDGNEV